jgi:hypothetical protein
MTEVARRKAHVVRAFKDAGTGERFEVGSTPLLDAGAYANFEAAGLIRAPDPAPRAAAKPSSKRKPAARKPDPAPAPQPSGGDQPA